MKVDKKLIPKNRKQSAFVIKDCRVNLIKLNKETIRKYTEIRSNNINYNVQLKINRDGCVSIVEETGFAVPMTISVTSSLPDTFDKSEKIYLLSKGSITEIKSKTLTKKPSNDIAKITNELADKSEHKYSLRKRIAIKVESESLTKKPSNAISQITTSVRKNQLWMKCKKDVNKVKLNVGAIVFAKQVCSTLIMD